MNPPVFTQTINVWPFINCAYAATVFFLLSITFLTYKRYRRARFRLGQAEQL